VDSLSLPNSDAIRNAQFSGPHCRSQCCSNGESQCRSH
jgi:hypothetical protein